MEQLIARIHAAMAEDCDCPRHRVGATKIDPAVLQRISAAIARDQAFASLTTVRAAIYDVIDKGSFSGWWALYDEGDNPEVTEDMVNQERCDFVDAVCARILELQREPYGMDARLREDALESQEFYELMQAYRHAAVTDQNATVAAFNAVKSFVGRAGDGGTDRFDQALQAEREACAKTTLALQAALGNIASQRLRSEIEPVDGEVCGDFEGAYDIKRERR
jgi:hypothetical protein